MRSTKRLTRNEHAVRPPVVTEHRTRKATATVFCPGNCIGIHKTLKEPAAWDNTVEWIQDKAQLATVMKLIQTQIWFVTDNGVNTWRAVNNITKIER